MKAKFVYENLEFKRSQDPKTSMDIDHIELLRRKAIEDEWIEPDDAWSREIALIYAADSLPPSDLKYLLDMGIDPDGPTELLGRPLLVAADSPIKTRMLLKAGADPNKDDASGSSLAARYGKIDIIKAYLEAGLNIHKFHDLIRKAVKGNQLEMVKFLVDQGIKLSPEEIETLLDDIEMSSRVNDMWRNERLPLKNYLESLAERPAIT
jgi:ankyrin repeat protein